MTYRSSLCAAAALALLAPAFAAFAQGPAPLPPKPVSWYGDPGSPDISGVWVRADTASPASRSKEGWLPWAPPLKAAYAATWKKRVADEAVGKRTDDPVRTCLPPGMPRFITGTNGPLQIIQTPGRVTMYRDGEPVRRIWVDGRANPAAKDLENFSNGNAIGHYDGTDLVTEVAGLRTEYPIDSTGVPHSEDLKIVERYHRIDATTLKVDVTLTDPVALTRAMTTTVTYKALGDPLWEPKEFLCTPVTGYHPDVYVH
jgi:hypothetical protein